MKPVVFLDIDGVLNHERLYRAQHDGKVPWPNPAQWIDRECVARVNDLCERTDARIVISSSWRSIPIPGQPTIGWEGATAVLRECGLTADVIGGTPVLDEMPAGSPLYVAKGRWPEIAAWLREHPTERWVVIDDGAVAVEPRGRLVQTDIAVGLTDVDVERAVAILNGGA